MLCNREYPCRLCKRLGIPCQIPPTVKKGRPPRAEQQARAERAAQAAALAATLNQQTDSEAAQEASVVVKKPLGAIDMATAVAASLWGGGGMGGQTTQPARAPVAPAAVPVPPSVAPPATPPTSPPEEPEPTPEMAQKQEEENMQGEEPEQQKPELSSVHDLYPARLFRVKAPKPIDIFYSIIVAGACACFLDVVLPSSDINMDSSSNDTFFADDAAAAALLNASDAAFDPMALPGRRLEEAAMHPEIHKIHEFDGYSSPWHIALSPAPFLILSAALCPGAPVDWSLPYIIFHALSASSIIGRSRYTYDYFFQICEYAARNRIDERVLLAWQASLLLTYFTGVARTAASLCTSGRLFWPSMRLMFVTNALVMLAVLSRLAYLEAPFTAPPLCLSRMGGLTIAGLNAVYAMGLHPALRYRWAQAVGIAQTKTPRAVLRLMSSLGSSWPLRVADDSSDGLLEEDAELSS